MGSTSYPNPSMLHLSSLAGDVALVKQLLATTHDVDLFSSFTPDGRGMVMTSLMCAVREGHEKVTRLLLKAGANPSAVSPDTGTSVLYHAAEYGHASIVTILLNAGAMIDSIDHEGRTALYVAALAGFDKVVRILTSAHASLDTTTNGGLTALMAAAGAGYEKCVRHLLLAGADSTKATSKEGFTCLHAGCAGGSVAVVNLLLDWDVPITLNVAPVDGRTASSLKGVSALYVAAQNGKVDVIRILLHAGAEIDWTSSPQGFSSLRAVAFGGHEKALQALITAGAMLDIVDYKGRTPLMAASSNGKDKCVRLLLEGGADVLLAAADGFTALHAASLEGKEDVVKTLLRWKADVHASDIIGRTPLWFAANRKHDNIVTLLIEAGAEPLRSVPATLLELVRVLFRLVFEIVMMLLEISVSLCAWMVRKAFLFSYWGVGTALLLVVLILQVLALIFISMLKVVDHFTGLGIIAMIRNYFDEADSEAADKPPEAGREDTTDVDAVTFKIWGDDINKARIVNLSDLVPYERESEIDVSRTAYAAVGSSVYSEIDQDMPEPDTAVEEVYVEEKQQLKVQQPCLNCQTQTHRRCGGCKISFFCSRVCQKATYKEHKPICLEICEGRRKAKAEREARRAAARAEVE